ncbi:putative bifunctional diguanylate cyclase/phosphodiesterase [Marinospirillum minutulum]|uniref:putative bifunctional diguanylate cyclase/phosphodiesterase n=1 Tax=Marinospirillum minutulum TaxID=64974 RepID=UPI00040E572D|nr:bifunctional diguanylate cyclase/phosphodiesterase [Marinospirillum minutulum]
MSVETLNRQQAILEAANELIATVSMDQRLTYINLAGRRMLGIPVSLNLDLERLHVRDFHPSDSYQLLNEQIFPQVVASCETWEGELELRNLKGEVFPAHLTLVPHTSEAKDEVLWITGIFRDLRRRKEFEAQRRLAMRVFESTIEGIMVTDGRARIQQVNAAFTDITGYQPEEVLGLTPKVLQSKHHDKAFYKAMWDSIAEVDHWKGEVWNRRKDGSVYLQWLSINCVRNELGEIENYISIIHDLSELRAKEAQIQHLAHHDVLTGLGNRHQLNERLNHAVRQAKSQQEELALLLVDLGHIQIINETFGHNWCDKLISEQSKKLRKRVGDADMLVRVGADEFALLVEDYDLVHDITQLANDIKNTLQKPVVIEGKQVALSPSIGVAFFPVDGLDADTLLSNAQAALSEAKNAGRDAFRFFDHKMTEEARNLLNLEQALRTAIEGKGLSLHFQPKVQLIDQQIYGVEALIRWQHPELGSLSPAVFIPLAEESGLIIEIGAWVVEETCRALVRWRDAGLVLPRVAINIAVQQLDNAAFPDWFESLLKHYNLGLDNFELEITETGLMQNELCALDTLSMLKQKGFRIALDDFGTGYSSLSYLRKLPLSTLKIDRSFIQDMGSDDASLSIVKTIVQLAHNLKLDLVAEGVEEEAQALQLLTMGCQQAQGFLYYKPLPEKELVKLLKSL